MNTSCNPQIDPNHVLIQNHLEKNIQDETNTTNNNEMKKENTEEPDEEESSDEDEKKEIENNEEEEEEDGQTESRVRTNTNETIVLTQQCSLVEPDQVQINFSPALVMAEPIVTLSGKQFFL